MNKHQNRKQSRSGKWKRDLKRLARSGTAWTALGVLLSAILGYRGYKDAGAEDLRNKVYSPLFSEIPQVESSILQNRGAQPFASDVLNALKKSGDFYRIPKSIQGEVERIYQDGSEIRGDLGAITAVIQSATSSRIFDWRSEEIDQQWVKETSERLHQLELNKPGVTLQQSLTFRHPGKGFLNARDPTRPIPGGPIWQISDWLTYPNSVDSIEPIWTSDQFLYFEESSDAWFYRITRADLYRHGTTLKQFLDPLYNSISKDSHFQHLSRSQPIVADEISWVKAMLIDRIRDPKQFSDLLPKN